MTRVAVVTGGASGIGEATGRLLAQRGVAVAVFDVTGDDAANCVCPGATLSGMTRPDGEDPCGNLLRSGQMSSLPCP